MKIKPILTAILLSITWSLILPFYFNAGSTVVCANHVSSCNGYSLTKVGTGAWHWFGGYHLIAQKFAAKPSVISGMTYNYSSDWLVVLFVVVSLLLGLVTYKMMRVKTTLLG
jgi:hypothetical protein